MTKKYCQRRGCWSSLLMAVLKLTGLLNSLTTKFGIFALNEEKVLLETFTSMRDSGLSQNCSTSVEVFIKTNSYVCCIFCWSLDTYGVKRLGKSH